MFLRVLAKKMRSIILIFVSVEDVDGRNVDNIWTIPPKRMALLGFYKKRNKTNIIFFLISIININHASLILCTKSWADQLHRWISSNRLPSSLLPCPSCPTIASIHSSTSINTSFICNSPTCVTLQQNHPGPCWAVQGNSEGNNRLDPLWRVITIWSAIREAIKLP